MTAEIHLCCAEEEEKNLLPKAQSAIEWALDRLDHLHVGDTCRWQDYDSPTMGYIERSLTYPKGVKGEASEQIRIRPDSTSLEDDILLVEPVRRGDTSYIGMGMTIEVLQKSLDRWAETFKKCRRLAANRASLQKSYAQKVADIVCAVADDPGKHFTVCPPSIHAHTQVLTLTAYPLEIPGQSEICERADQTLGNVAWLKPTAGSGVMTWGFVQPSSYGFETPRLKPDPMATMRAYAALTVTPPER